MLKFFPAALFIWALGFSGANCGSAKVQSPKSSEKAPEMTPDQRSLKLTNEHTSGAFPIGSDLLSNIPEVLEVSIAKVNNPDRTPVDIFVYLSQTPKQGERDPDRILLGNFSLYPPDRPGKFLMKASPAFRKLVDSKGTNAADVQLLFEMKRLDEKRPWTAVEVTVGLPQWRPAKE